MRNRTTKRVAAKCSARPQTFLDALRKAFDDDTAKHPHPLLATDAAGRELHAVVAKMIVGFLVSLVCAIDDTMDAGALSPHWNSQLASADKPARRHGKAGAR